MLSAITHLQVLFHQIVDLVNAGSERFHQSAATHDDVDGVQVETGLLQFGENDISTELILVGYGVELGQLLGGMLDIFNIDLFASFKNSDFCRGRSWIDGENSFHKKLFRLIIG